MPVPSLGRLPCSFGSSNFGSALTARPGPMGLPRKPRAVTVQAGLKRCCGVRYVPAHRMPVPSLGRLPRSLGSSNLGPALTYRPGPMGLARAPWGFNLLSGLGPCWQPRYVPGHRMPVRSIGRLPCSFGSSNFGPALTYRPGPMCLPRKPRAVNVNLQNQSHCKPLYGCYGKYVLFCKITINLVQIPSRKYVQIPGDCSSS